MAGKLTPAAQAKLAELETLNQRLARCHSLVEQYAAARGTTDTIPLKRAFADLKRAFMVAGFDTQSQLAGAMEVAAGRGTGVAVKSRILREGVGSLRFQMELEQRTLVREGQVEEEKPEEPEREEPKPAEQAEPAAEE